MTLKVIRNVNEWLLVCGVKEMWVIKHPNGKRKDVPVGEIKFIGKIMNDQKPTPDFTEIIYQDDGGDWNQIEFNTEAYVCNDFGKTVEKIYG